MYDTCHSELYYGNNALLVLTERPLITRVYP